MSSCKITVMRRLRKAEQQLHCDICRLTQMSKACRLLHAAASVLRLRFSACLHVSHILFLVTTQQSQHPHSLWDKSQARVVSLIVRTVKVQCELKFSQLLSLLSLDSSFDHFVLTLKLRQRIRINTDSSAGHLDDALPSFTVGSSFLLAPVLSSRDRAGYDVVRLSHSVPDFLGFVKFKCFSSQVNTQTLR